MYTCANCGTGFEGNVCPKCCTMRPMAAVIGESGSILKKRRDSGLAPGQHAARFAQEMEQSRRAESQQETERQRQKAMNWTRKAPMARTLAQNDESIEHSVVVPDALRSLKITPEIKPQDTAAEETERQAENESQAVRSNDSALDGKVSAWVRLITDTPAFGVEKHRVPEPSQPRVHGTERTDAAWRAFAKGKPKNS